MCPKGHGCWTMLDSASHLLLPRDSPKPRTKLLGHWLLCPSWKPEIKLTLRTAGQLWIQASLKDCPSIPHAPPPQSSSLSHISLSPGACEHVRVIRMAYAGLRWVTSIKSILRKETQDGGLGRLNPSGQADVKKTTPEKRHAEAKGGA